MQSSAASGFAVEMPPPHRLLLIALSLELGRFLSGAGLFVKAGVHGHV